MIFTDEDLQNIKSAKDAGGEVWTKEILAEVKRKIKLYYRSNGQEVCCYCRRDLTDEFNMVIDIEHILPKSKYGEYMFELGNLNISCKRCNMRIKKEDDDFIVDKTSIRLDYSLPEQYYLIHPNFDTYKDNLEDFRIAVNGTKITKYFPKTEKGRYTYKYFQLKEFEVNSLNSAQGISSQNEEDIASVEIAEEIKKTLEMLLSKL